MAAAVAADTCAAVVVAADVAAGDDGDVVEVDSDC